MASQAQLTWYGHAAFKLVTPAGNVLLIDPWLTNPVFENGKDDHFTMGPKRAADAVKLVEPRAVIPMHYGTFPVLTGTPEAFDRELKQRHVKAELRVMKVGETITLAGS